MRRATDGRGSQGTRSYGLIETDLGWVGVMRSERGICAATLPRRTLLQAATDLDVSPHDREAVEDEFVSVAAVLRSQLAGSPLDLAVPLDLSSGTEFQQAVWRSVCTIPFGETRSYGWVAEALGAPRAAHAVGQAVARNRIAILVPCHRVVAADGGLGGFGYGSEALPAKRSLLRREGIWFEGPTLEQIRPGTGDCHETAGMRRQRG